MIYLCEDESKHDMTCLKMASILCYFYFGATDNFLKIHRIRYNAIRMLADAFDVLTC